MLSLGRVRSGMWVSECTEQTDAKWKISYVLQIQDRLSACRIQTILLKKAIYNPNPSAWSFENLMRYDLCVMYLISPPPNSGNSKSHALWHLCVFTGCVMTIPTVYNHILASFFVQMSQVCRELPSIFFWQSLYQTLL